MLLDDWLVCDVDRWRDECLLINSSYNFLLWAAVFTGSHFEDFCTLRVIGSFMWWQDPKSHDDIAKLPTCKKKRQKSESVLLFISLPHPMFWFHKLTILIKDDRGVLWKHKYNIIRLDTELLPLSISERPTPLLNIFQHLEGKTRRSLLKKRLKVGKKSLNLT